MFWRGFHDFETANAPFRFLCLCSTFISFKGRVFLIRYKTSFSIGIPMHSDNCFAKSSAWLYPRFLIFDLYNGIGIIAWIPHNIACCDISTDILNLKPAECEPIGCVLVHNYFFFFHNPCNTLSFHPPMAFHNGYILFLPP